MSQQMVISSVRPVRVRSLVLAAAVLFVPLAAAVWWFMPLAPRAALPAGSEILRLSPDGRLLATRRGGQVTLWNLAGLKAGALAEDLAAWPVWGFVFSTDGRWLAAGGAGFVKVWEMPSGSERAAVPVSADKKFRARPLFSPDGKWLAFRTGGANQASKVIVWDLAQAREHTVIPGHAGAMRFSPDSKTLALETWNTQPERPSAGTIHLWDLETGKEKAGLETKPAPLRRLAFSPDGRILATGERKRAQWDGPYEVKLWDMAAGKSRTWKVPLGVIGLRFTGDGSRLLVTSFAKAWQVSLIDPGAAPAEVTPIPDTNSLSLSISADGRLLARSPNQPDEPATIIELPALTQRAQLIPNSPGERLFLNDFSPDGKRLAVVSGWNDAPTRRGRLFRSKSAASSSTSPDAALLDGELHLFDTDSGALEGTVPIVRSARVWFTPDSKALAVLAPDGTPTIWDLPLRQPWGRILACWALLLAGCLGVAGLWLRFHSRRPPSTQPITS